MELKLEHLAPYFPYELDLQLIIRGQVSAEETMTRISHHIWETHPTKIAMGCGNSEHIWMFKPLLRPLSQIQSYFEPLWDSDIDVRTYLSEEYISSFGFESIEEMLEHKIEWWPVGFYTTLLKHHFDLFELIENGLATIKE